MRDITKGRETGMIVLIHIVGREQTNMTVSMTIRIMTLIITRVTELFILFAANAFRKLSSIYVFSYFPFGFEGRIWDLIVSVPDHCLSFYFTVAGTTTNHVTAKVGTVAIATGTIAR